jgi:hypothetical protein
MYVMDVGIKQSSNLIVETGVGVPYIKIPLDILNVIEVFLQNK